MTPVLSPHAWWCPVCEGRGKVPADFYADPPRWPAAPVECRTCQGLGLLWAEG